MNCNRTRRLLPLFAGGDLPERKARRIRKHLETCAECRRELEGYRKALGAVADAVREAPSGDWAPGEWRTMMARIAEEKPAPRKPAAAAPALTPKWVPAFASAAVIVLVVAVGLLLKDSVSQPSASKGEGLAAAAPDSSKQDVLTMTLVSPDTGLQVVWVFNKGFDWKGESN